MFADAEFADELLEPEQQDEEVEESKPIHHPLSFSWIIWYGPPPKKGAAAGEVTTLALTSWEEHLQPVKDFSTVEHFWISYRELKSPCTMEAGASYHLFKKGIKPMWEDQNNVKGGKWSWNINASEAHKIDSVWERLILITVGGTLEADDAWDHVTGVVIGKKKQGVKMGVWMRDTTSEPILRTIATRIRECVQLSKHVNMEFYEHNSGKAEPLLRA